MYEEKRVVRETVAVQRKETTRVIVDQKPWQWCKALDDASQPPLILTASKLGDRNKAKQDMSNAAPSCS